MIRRSIGSTSSTLVCIGRPSNARQGMQVSSNHDVAFRQTPDSNLNFD